jgi:hypothetical protein
VWPSALFPVGDFAQILDLDRQIVRAGPIGKDTLPRCREIDQRAIFRCEGRRQPPVTTRRLLRMPPGNFDS